MKYAVTVTETLEVTYIVEAPDAEKAEEAFSAWAEQREAIINNDLFDGSTGWDYEICPDNFAGDNPDIVWEGGENNADR